MINSIDIFCEIPCLTEKSKSFSSLHLQKKHFKFADKRIIGQYIQKFIEYNSSMFNFLGVVPIISGTDLNTTLHFHTSNFIGAIPLRAPDTGKQIGDFIVTPRFNNNNIYEDYIQVLNILGEEINPEISPSLPLISGINFRPPLYIEAVSFINSLEKLIKFSWQKFNSKTIISQEPTGQVNWNKYIENEYKVEHRIKFPTKKNYLTNKHTEYSQIKFVFEICKNELSSTNTPIRIRNNFRNRISFIEQKLYNIPTSKTKNIQYRNSDSPTVKVCKKSANKILNKEFQNSTAWRVDFSLVFERFIQHIFKIASSKIGARFSNNLKFKAKSSTFYSWELRHLEPDGVISKNGYSILVDAKYKSNLYNKFHDSTSLKKEFRHDLHQILAYSGFNATSNKYGILCYPSNNLELKTTKFENSLSKSTSCVILLGVPIKISSIDTTVELLIREFHKIETSELAWGH